MFWQIQYWVGRWKSEFNRKKSYYFGK